MTPQDTAQTDAPSQDPEFERGLAAHRAGKLSDAVAIYTALLRQHPHRSDALNNLGVALRQAGRHRSAETCYRRLLAIEGENAGLLVNLGNCLRDQAKLAEAKQAYQQAIELDESLPSGWHGMGLIERDLENLEASVAAFDKAIALSSDDRQYGWDRALSLLRLGDYEQGFIAYESRWNQPGQKKIRSSAAEWDGTPFADQTLLLYGEQGFGDVIQFARFIPLAIKRGGTVVLLVRPELVTLFESQFGNSVHVVSRDDGVPEHDVILPILSLPRVLGIDLSKLQADPYFTAAQVGFALPAYQSDPVIRVALAWAGSPTQKNDRNRSFPLLAMAPILARDGIEFYSVQKGPAERQLVDSGLAYLITDLAPNLQNFADTSAALGEMDLVISCDSAVVHLAGALGKPVWIALSVFHDWRYGPNGDITPWYPSASVYKQTKPGDWEGVFERMAQDLEGFAGSRPTS